MADILSTVQGLKAQLVFFCCFFVFLHIDWTRLVSNLFIFSAGLLFSSLLEWQRKKTPDTGLYCKKLDWLWARPAWILQKDKNYKIIVTKKGGLMFMKAGISQSSQHSFNYWQCIDIDCYCYFIGDKFFANTFDRRYHGVWFRDTVLLDAGLYFPFNAKSGNKLCP